MNSTSLNAWLETLQAVAPPQGALLVGAGPGTSPLVRWLLQALPGHVCLVEADPNRFRSLQRNLPARAGWSLCCETVAPSAAPVPFHHLSNPAENGLLPLQALQKLWPNLRAADSDEPRPGTTLATLLAGSANATNWLLIDCLPAAPLLQGAGPALGSLDVVAVRVVLDESAAIPSAQHATADTLLKQAGFRCVHREPERHPALALALYLRDIRAAQSSKQQHIEQLEAELLELKFRARQQSEELAKAENQISIIQELLVPANPS